MQEQQDEGGWHLDKRIHIGHLLTTGVAAVSIVMYVLAIDKRVAIIENQVVSLHEQDNIAMKEIKDTNSQLQTRLDRIDSKLDTLIFKHPLNR